MRSWPKSITTGTLFSETLYYNESYNGNTPRYDGNISAMAWKADAKNRAFRYAYDKFGRLSSAVYLEEGVANQHYDEAFTYDKMGNVQSITRYGLRDNSQYGLIDNVSLYYIGNQVVHADDAVTGPNYAGAFHFRDSNGTQWDTEYEYDKNGRLTRDRNKGILQIQYNLLNLPSKTTFSDGGSINYQYSASGMKQMVWGSAPGQGSKSQFYLGNYVYSNGVKQLLVDGGYVTFSGTTPQYHFYVKDHLGNNRMVVNASGTVEQVSHYYAFGGLMGENTGSDLQDFKYNGKELDRLHGLDWYDYNARHKDAVRGVFTTMDPLAEKYYNISPYAYCANNPILLIDPNGMKIDLSNMSEDQLKKYNDAIRTLRNNSPLFSNLYQSLDASDNVFTITLGSPVSNSDNNAIDGQFVAHDAGGGDIILSESKMMGDGISDVVYAEEYFHAYQHENSSSYDNGAFNREFEAKVFATAVGLESSGFIDYHGMEDFQAAIRDEAYGNSLQPISSQGVNSQQFQKEYISRANAYAKYNRTNNIGNQNYRKPTTVSPYSLKKIINATY